jgi:alpha-tubulin suppressor-like RCC1 family protein
MTRTIPPRLSAAWLPLVLIALAACTDSDTVTEPSVLPGHGSIGFYADVSGTTVKILVVEVTADDITDPLVFNVEIDDQGNGSTTLTIPAGPDRTITVHAYNVDDLETHRGEATVDVIAGPNPRLAIRLEPLLGELPIDVFLVSYTIEIGPVDPTMIREETLQLTATITDTEGNVVSESVRWATARPAIATVDENGVVTALAEGEVEIVATFSGAGGSVAIQIITLEAVAAGFEHSCGLTPDGVAYCWGRNFEGQLGIGVTGGNRTRPARVAGDLTFASIVAGDLHSCGLTGDGAAYCWGRNSEGQIGTGAFSPPANTPTAVTGGLSFAEISAGALHTCGRTDGGAAHCWGRNFEGELGDATNSNKNVPTPVSGGLAFASISAGRLHTCGITSTGVAYCWGINTSGELGIGGTGGTRTVPTAVTGGLTLVSISAGGLHTCGLAVGGAAHCWGRNFEGQLGRGAFGGIQPSPGAVAGGLTFESISGGLVHTCAIVPDGAAYCWGSNTSAELGIGAGGNRNQPTAVAGGLSFSSLDAGSRHSCAVTTDVKPFCWGLNVRGQLGDGSTTTRNQPVAVTNPQ